MHISGPERRNAVRPRPFPARPVLAKPILVLSALLTMLLAAHPAAAALRSVTTHHYDKLRTGWNNRETTLTPRNVGSPKFGLLHQVLLDEQVDAQPLLVDAVTIAGNTLSVVYVATENNTVYALAARTGETLASRNLGPPVPQSALPGQCPLNSVVVGINSTPVIDKAKSILYVMAYIYSNNTTPTFILYALDLGTLQDKLTPTIVRAAAPLADGSAYSFDPAVSRQRPALLQANGNIYAGFGSFCDLAQNRSRGWVLGWNAATLAPLPANRLIDQQAHSAGNGFLSSIWMSGSGLAAAEKGPLFFVTGNSDRSGTAYDPVTNLSESVVKVSPDLTAVRSFFTPSDPAFGVTALEKVDEDFGSGGVMLLPHQPGTQTDLVVAAGKAGQMYLLNWAHLGRYSPSGQNHVLGTYAIGKCFCGESYFTGPDGAGRVVSSGGRQIIIWKVQTSPQPGLVAESRLQPLPMSVHDRGLFTSVSSNGAQTPIIWVVNHPVSAADDAVVLYAFDPVAAAAGDTNWLFSGNAGTWPNLSANSNIVPVVANGLVYVASYKELDIFGLGTASSPVRQGAMRRASPAPPAPMPLPAGMHEVYGTIATLGDGKMILTTRAGTPIVVAVRDAIDAAASVDLRAGEVVRVVGGYDRAHVLHASSIITAKPSPKAWPADR